jgi:hypothetical protein
VRFLPWQHRDLDASALLAWARDYEKIAARHAHAKRARLALSARNWAAVYRNAASAAASKEAA